MTGVAGSAAADVPIEVRLATPADAMVLGHLLVAFNTEFDTPTPAAEVLAGRLRGLLSTPGTFAVLATDGVATLGFGLVSLRTNVWYDGPVALLDELYVEPSRRGEGIGGRLIETVLGECRVRRAGSVEVNVDEPDIDAMRFYLRHGFVQSEAGSTDRAFYIWQEFTD